MPQLLYISIIIYNIGQKGNKQRRKQNLFVNLVNSLSSKLYSAAMSGSSTVKLYGHWSSSCSRRVRFALNLTGLKYEYKPVVSVTDPDFLKLNPMGYVPVLVDDIVVVSDSLAILLYLGEKYNQCCLLPRDLQKRAINYQVASIVTSSIQPLQNMSIVNYIGEKTDPDEKLHWAQSHIRKGFVALEKLLADHAGKYATGDEIYLGDVFLAPQLDNGINRFKLDMTPFPILSRLNESYSELPAYKQAKEEF